MKCPRVARLRLVEIAAWEALRGDFNDNALYAAWDAAWWARWNASASHPGASCDEAGCPHSIVTSEGQKCGREEA